MGWGSVRKMIGCAALTLSGWYVAIPLRTCVAAVFGQSRVERAGRQADLPLYKVIPAAADAELTPGMEPVVRSSEDWPRSNSDASNTRYSGLTQINRGNVSALRIAWVYHSADGNGNIEANPVIVKGILYTPTPGRQVVAIDASTGKELWRFHHFVSSANVTSDTGYGPATRGLIYWKGSSERAGRLYFMANGYLYALDAKTGRRVEGFGNRGAVAATKGAGTSGFLGSVAPVIYQNIIIAPNQNFVEAYNAVTGARYWRFNTIGYHVADPNADNGGNVWGGIALDEKRGIVFVATGDPHPNFVGIDRPGNDPYTNSILALDARTGRLLWTFQDIAHDLWDLDMAAPPNLVTIRRAGKWVDAVAEVTKSGNTLLLDRLTGKPLFPFRLKRAPASKLAGERTAPYQPALQLPQPFARQQFSLDSITDLSPSAHRGMLERVRHMRWGWFEPFEEGERTVIYPGTLGGADWPGAAFDPVTGILYITSNELPSVVTQVNEAGSPFLVPLEMATPGAKVFEQHCAVCHGTRGQGQGMAPSLETLRYRLGRPDVVEILHQGRGAMPPMPLTAIAEDELLSFLLASDSSAPKEIRSTHSGAGSSVVLYGFTKLRDDRGYPGVKPPWGTLNALDLNSGKLRWKVPLGEYPELAREGIHNTGTTNFGGATITAGGLIFCAGTDDRQIRAFDKTSGKKLWQHALPYGGYAPPAVYEVRGREYVVIAATGGGKIGSERGDAYVAFALPRAID